MADSAVRLVEGAARPTVVVARETTWKEFPSLWSSMLDEVYAVVKAAAVQGAESGEPRWQNVMLYKDDVPNVEVGVLGSGAYEQTASVVASALPGGPAAATTHRGPYAGLDAAHRRVRDWCAAHGRALAGPRWEIYGHWRDDPDELETEVYYLLR